MPRTMTSMTTTKTSRTMTTGTTTSRTMTAGTARSLIFNYWCHELVAAFLPDLVHGQAFVLVGGTLCAQGVRQETIAWPCANSIFVHLMPHGPSFISPYLVVSFRLCLRHAKTT
ncbi:unnamed protein product [Cladocopium goreaui]|uniref:Uncharacterized protein n=1 Tax=Cladocopium goreaui TaxID=2562237 RepID=A0A9P1FTU1_9DINO|nr:unnamed protein product [Cladocopium goreaui]